MKSHYWLMLLALASGQAGYAAGAGDRSPYDSNPACMDTRTDSSTGNCVIQSEDTSRQRYPAPGPSSMPGNSLGYSRNTGASIGTATTAAPSLMRAAPNSGGRK
jgi:hypothetical protein